MAISRKHWLATTGLGLIISCFAVESALAQPAAPSAPASSVETVTVTGTSIRGVEAVGSETVQLSRDDMLATGLNSPVDVLRTIPQIQNLGFDSAPHTAQNGGGNIQRGTAISLRGLASNATLILIDGHRIAPTGNVFSFVEANQLPVSAIQRIDVVADGASAVYGSDAVAGVVNYIPRKDFNGIEVDGRFKNNNFFNEEGAALLGGANWDSAFGLGAGHLVAAYDYDHQDDMLRGASPYLRQNLAPFGANDGRINGNVATSGPGGNIVVASAKNTVLPTAGNFTYYGIPQTGTPTAATLLVNQPNLLDTADYTDFVPSQQRHQFFVYANQDINDFLSVYYEAYFDQRRSNLRNGNGLLSGVRTLPATSPFYVAGVPGVAAGAAETVSFSFLNALGATTQQHINDDSLSSTAGVSVKLPWEWKGEASFTYSFDRECANCINALNANIDTVVMQAELNNGNLNPFSVAPVATTELAKFLPAGIDKSHAILDDTVVKFDGPLFDLPGGTVRAAVGGEYQGSAEFRSSIGIKATSDTPLAYAHRHVLSFYGELFIPLIGADNALPLVQKLVIDAAVRTERYSDFGGTTNPKIGLTWDVDNDLTIHGAWGTSFRAPNLVENNPAFFSRVALATISNAAGDPAIPVTNVATGQSNVVQISGSTANLSPEKATNYSVGAVYHPNYIPNLDLTATYYNIAYSNQIVGLQTVGPTFLASAANRALYAPYIIPAIQPKTCVNGQPATYNPLYVTALNQPSLTAVDQSNFCSATAIISTRNANASTTNQDGTDPTASYLIPSDIGNFTAALSGSKIFHNKQALVPAAALLSALDTINNPVSLRYRASMTWNDGPWTASLAANFIGSYLNNLPITVNGVVQPVARVPSWPTGDLSVAYATPDDNASWQSGMRLALTVLNFTDRKPPTVLSTNGAAFDDQNANIYGRQWSLQLSKKF